jgi:hypothetical protein
VGSGWPSVTSVLVTVKLGTTGKRQNGSFMVCLHSEGLWYTVIIDRREREDDRRRSSSEIATICSAELTTFGDCR